jgi:hypothetical protein
LSSEGFADAWHFLSKKNFLEWYAAGIPSQFALRAPDLSSETRLVRHPKAADTHHPAGFL